LRFGYGRQLLVSIAAGVTVSASKIARQEARVVRVMPNARRWCRRARQPLLPGRTQAEDIETAKVLLSAVCKVVVAVGDEKLMDAVTGLSGSGPAYVFLMLEALSDAGVRVGLGREESFTLAAQTMIGAAHMAVQTREPLSKLKDMVTSRQDD
jgi:pyrroline-5-carboxylate reductase